MLDPATVLVPAVLLAAAFVHGVFGFGFPMLATPLLALGMPLPGAMPASKARASPTAGLTA